MILRVMKKIENQNKVKTKRSTTKKNVKEKDIMVAPTFIFNEKQNRCLIWLDDGFGPM